jgi:ATP-dependent RNA helicase MRH4, mitochondrial
MNVLRAPANLQPSQRNVSPVQQRRERGLGNKDEKKTKDPMHALKMQRALTNVSYEKRVRVKERLAGFNSFDEFDLLPSIKESIPTQALKGMTNISPTPIQRLAIPALLDKGEWKAKFGRRSADSKEMQQFLLAAETGTGKTLAYILPVIDALKRQEVTCIEQRAAEAAKEQQEVQAPAKNRLFDVEPPPVQPPDANTARPRAIILLPTSELVDQVGATIKDLSHTVKYRAALLSANYTSRVIRSRLFTTSGVDIVITTPHLLYSITESDPNILSKVSHLVIDEADSLLDRSFSPVTTGIIDRAKPSLKQLIFCSATISRSLDNHLQREYPNMKRLTTPNLHAIPRRVMMSVVDIDRIPYHGNRNLACAQVIWEIGKEGRDEEEEGWIPRPERKIVVFVNEREKSEELAEYLRSKGINAAALNRDAEARKDENVLAAFTGQGIASALPPMKQRAMPAPGAVTAISPGELAEQAPALSTALARAPRTKSGRELKQSTRTLSHTSVLVTTDILSRGIDTLPVKHVVLYDVPHTSIDFIHRLGRVGRMGKRGRGVVLVGRKDRKDIVREVRDGMFKGSALI